MPEKILVTTALPYANGSIHLGHVLEGIQADIWVRFQRSIGNTCYFFCADDTHGTPIMLAARKADVTPDEFIEKVHKEHFTDLSAFGIEYNNYYTTNSPENKILAEEIYLKLKSKGNIADKKIQQTYCEHDKMFLPDRFIKGKCPKCGALDQYGDSCEVCGATYNPSDLKDPHCAICGNTPVLRESKHLFFKLQDYQAELKEWIESGDKLAEGAKKKLLEWFGSGLKEWDISRDGPYFGFKIPGEENKYFYVWLDAPIGYMAASKKFFEDKPEEFNSIWREKGSRIVHFIGKDILYFHGLFWPAMLMGAEFNTPDKIHVHGFMTVGGEKMSKSRGTFINASTFAKYNDTEHFRYYMAARLGAGMDDVDISFEDFLSRINSDLIGNLVNIISRVSTSLMDKLDRKLGTIDSQGKDLLDELLSREDTIRNFYEEKQYSRVIREVTTLGDKINKYVNDRAPWLSIKTDEEATRKVITVALNAGRILFTYLYPVLPIATKRLYSMLNLDEEPSFSLLGNNIENSKIGAYIPLSSRPDAKSIQAMIDETKMEYEKSIKNQTKENKTELSKKKMEETNETGIITIEDLTKVELRVGLIREANHVEGADKLLQVTVDLGEMGSRNVFAGIKQAYSPEDLKGLMVVVVANLKPRKMKFGMSEAMLLASGSGDNLSLFVPHRTASPGDLLK